MPLFHKAQFKQLFMNSFNVENYFDEKCLAQMCKNCNLNYVVKFEQKSKVVETE